MGKTELYEYLISKRDEEKATLVDKANEEDGYFDAQEYSGGNFDDAFYLGQETGRAELVEELIALLEG